jgi:hypothetical protein
MKLPASLLFLLIASLLINAQSSGDERDIARNPVADAIKFPLVEDVFFDTGPYGRMSNSLQIQPVLPFQFTETFLLVPRLVATPVTYIPDLTQAKGGTTGLADTTVTLFITPVNAGKLFIWGVGPALLAPTATHADIGGGKWDIGPAIVLLTEPKWGSAAVLAQNLSSLPGHSNRVSVDQMQIETSVSYNLPRDWYLLTAPTINADWTQVTGNRWLVPLGGGAGRTLEMGHYAVDVNLALYYNAIRPSPAPKWQLSLQFTLIYPKEQKSASH